ncbi:MAG: type II toxin-antitoxin system VapC family toxin [Spirochaetaceae bacterium]|nr:type II toxin-antitoxin system VapC family toxin [Spirochaetaceae bacterium]
MNLYAESSAVLSWLLGEKRGEAARERLLAADMVITSDLTLVECDRALHRAEAVDELEAETVKSMRERFFAATDHWIVFSIDREVVERSRRRFPREPIRSLDAIHLTTALLVRSLVTELELLCWDERIRENADELGFDVTPNTGEETNR